MKEVGLAFECTGLINKFELIYVCVCTLSSNIVALFMSVVCKVNEGGLSRLCWQEILLDWVVFSLINHEFNQGVYESRTHNQFPVLWGHS